MVLMSDGNSEKGAHVKVISVIDQFKAFDKIGSSHKSYFFPKRPIFFLSSKISTMDNMEDLSQVSFFHINFYMQF